MTLHCRHGPCRILSACVFRSSDTLQMLSQEPIDHTIRAAGAHPFPGTKQTTLDHRWALPHRMKLEGCASSFHGRQTETHCVSQYKLIHYLNDVLNLKQQLRSLMYQPRVQRLFHSLCIEAE